ncbi:uncharacterized protein LOC116165187 [Photinus pyralis]|uniref:uncharacterized protein LOC116165187 n=1 Tax=Photinus pyralis TaxID=7054 RepID=UPI0012674262|nr:uncharacterized protein LOC116165187 [Photinus pyralis]
MSWSSDQISCLSEEYRKYPVLYFVKHKDYHNKALRNGPLQTIAAALQKLRPNVTEADLQKKFLGLRTTYSNERRKVLASLRSGMDSDSVYQPSLWYYAKMEFLNNHLAIRTSVSNLDALVSNTEEYVVEDNVLSPVSDTGTITPRDETPALSRSGTPIARKRKATKKDNDNELLSQMTKHLGSVVSTLNNPKETSNDDDIFASFISSQLKMISDQRVKANVKYEIHGILHKAMNN